MSNIERYLVLSVTGQFGFAGTVFHVLVTAFLGPLWILRLPLFFPPSIFLLRLVSDEVGGGGVSVYSWKAVPKVEALGVQKTKPQRFILLKSKKPLLL